MGAVIFQYKDKQRIFDNYEEIIKFLPRVNEYIYLSFAKEEPNKYCVDSIIHTFNNKKQFVVIKLSRV